MISYDLNLKDAKRQFVDWFLYKTMVIIVFMLIYYFIVAIAIFKNIIKTEKIAKETFSILFTMIFINCLLVLYYFIYKKKYINSFNEKSVNGNINYTLTVNNDFIILKNNFKGTDIFFRKEDIKKSYQTKKTYIVVLKNKQTILFPNIKELVDMLE